MEAPQSKLSARSMTVRCCSASIAAGLKDGAEARSANMQTSCWCSVVVAGVLLCVYAVYMSDHIHGSSEYTYLCASVSVCVCVI